MFLVKILSKQDYISIALLLYITNLYWYLLNIKQILETNVDPRSFLTQRHNKFSCIISQARVSNNIRFFRGVKKLSAPSWDSDVACQILTSSNLVLCKKNNNCLAPFPLIYLFIFQQVRDKTLFESDSPHTVRNSDGM